MMTGGGLTTLEFNKTGNIISWQNMLKKTALYRSYMLLNTLLLLSLEHPLQEHIQRVDLSHINKLQIYRKTWSSGACGQNYKAQ